MIVVVGTALFRAPLADLGTHSTVLFGVLAVASHRPNTQLAYICALDAALRAIVLALFASHCVCTLLTGDNTLLTSFDAILVLGHSLVPFEMGLDVWLPQCKSRALARSNGNPNHACAVAKNCAFSAQSDR